MSPPVLLILGAGSRVGASIAKHFSSAGYAIALVSRSAPSPPAVDPSTSFLRVRADLSVPAQVSAAFAVVRSHFGGAAPRVVVYNAATVSQPPDEENLLSLDVGTVEGDLRVNALGAFFYADERKEDGSGAGGDLGADSHGKFYLELAEGNVAALPSDVTFVDGEYKKF
ncbi:hypothetical protein K4K57_010330 [Colletotrichum sp. SAR 10_99]|nr:hypothetical protein K4K55_009061 [Colletotrichum sp. SAR 10_96]KAJ5008277.1 hypothetical protein K4K57_010330 [Colletotrichum sp. SAR 10_99]